MNLGVIKNGGGFPGIRNRYLLSLCTSVGFTSSIQINQETSLGQRKRDFKRTCVCIFVFSERKDLIKISNV